MHNHACSVKKLTKIISFDVADVYKQVQTCIFSADKSF